MEDAVLQTALDLATAGMSVVPIMPDGSKKPAVAWKEWQSKIASSDEIARLFRPGFGIAVINGSVSGNKETLDIDAPELVQPFEAAVEAMCPGLLDRLVIVATPRNNHGGRHYHYRVAGQVPGNLKLAMLDPHTTLIETRGEGGYAIIPPSPGACHETGLPYEYASVVEFANCPLITAEERDILLTVAKSLDESPIAEQRTSWQGSCADESSPGEDFNQTGTWEEVLEPAGWKKLFTDSRQITYWRRPGKERGGASATTGCKSVSGRSLLRVFSTNAGLDVGNYTRFGALAAIHFQNDFAQAAIALRDRGFGEIKVPTVQVDLTQLLNASQPAEVPVVSFPEICFDEMPLMMRWAFDYAMNKAIKPQPELILASLIAMFGTIFGRKVKDDYDTRTNIMVLGLAGSGAGKDSPRKVCKEVLLNAGLEQLNGSEDIASDAGIMSLLTDYPARLFLIDEMGRFLQTAKNPDRSPHIFKIITTLMKLYSSANTQYLGTAYADKRKNQVINQPHICIYGTSTPKGFYEGLTSDNLSDGFLARLLVIQPTHFPKRQKPLPVSLPPELIGRIQFWYQNSPGTGNLASVNPEPLLIEKTPEANDRHEEYCEAVHSKHESEDETRASVWSRAPEKAAKLALIYACCDCQFGKPTITVDAVNWAIRLVNYSTRMVLQGADDTVSSSKHEADKKRLWRSIKNGMTRRELVRTTQWIRGRRERNEMLAELEEIEAIQILKGDSGPQGGRPVEIIKKLRTHL